MELAHDLLSALRGRLQPAADGGACAGFDWLGLHARMSAAHAARRELAGTDSRYPIREGGFGDWSLTPHHAAHGAPNSTFAVNLTDSTDGKQPHGMNAVVAAKFHRGDRGQ